MEGSTKKEKRSLFLFTAVMCVAVIAGMAVYYQYMKKQQARAETTTPVTEAEKLIAKDLEVGYPETPKEVMKLWGRLNQCLYNSGMSDEKFLALVKQLRMLYCTDLLEQNPEEEHVQKMQEDTVQFRKDTNNIVRYAVQSEKEIQYKKINEKECANLQISYLINQGDGYAKEFQEFILVKENDHWKVLGFRTASQQTSQTADGSKKAE